ncbi:hypothetical protein [Thermotoga caldifontis]|nr:hypothetical protein [Thermotoga caldifontis]
MSEACRVLAGKTIDELTFIEDISVTEVMKHGDLQSGGWIETHPMCGF